MQWTLCNLSHNGFQQVRLAGLSNLCTRTTNGKSVQQHRLTSKCKLYPQLAPLPANESPELPVSAAACAQQRQKRARMQTKPKVMITFTPPAGKRTEDGRRWWGGHAWTGSTMPPPWGPRPVPSTWPIAASIRDPKPRSCPSHCASTWTPASCRQCSGGTVPDPWALLSVAAAAPNSHDLPAEWH